MAAAEETLASEIATAAERETRLKAFL